MPLLYEIVCQQCGDRSACFTGQYAAFIQDNGTEITLPHPGEQGVLERLEWTWGSAVSEGRLRIYSAYGCVGCRSICYRPERHSPGACQKCGDTELKEIDDGELFTCPSCKQRTARACVAGIS